MNSSTVHYTYLKKSSLVIESAFLAHLDTPLAFPVACGLVTGAQVVAAFRSRVGLLAKAAESTNCFAVDTATQITLCFA